MVFACVRGQPRVIDMSFGYEPQPIPLLSNGVDDANFKLTFQVTAAVATHQVRQNHP